MNPDDSSGIFIQDEIKIAGFICRKCRELTDFAVIRLFKYGANILW